MFTHASSKSRRMAARTIWAAIGIGVGCETAGAAVSIQNVIDSTATGTINASTQFFFRNFVMNNTGQIAFIAPGTASSSDYAIYLTAGPGQPFSKLIHAGQLAPEGSFSGFTDLSLNDVGGIAFRAGIQRFDGTVFGTLYRGTLSGGTSSLVRIAAINDPSSPWSDVGRPRINDAGTVVFQARYPTGETVIARGPNLSTDILANTAGPFAELGGEPAMNNAGTLAFAARLDTGAYGVFTGTNPATDTYVSTAGDLQQAAVRNDMHLAQDGHIYYEYRWIQPDGTGKTRLATGPQFRGADFVAEGNEYFGEGQFGDFWGDRAMNNHHAVVFAADAQLNGQIFHGLFNGPSPRYHRLIGTGDALFGSTITGFGTNDNCFTDDGRLLFTYALANGTHGLAVMQVPAPTPTWITNGSGSWPTSGNWFGGVVPGGVGATALFLDAITAAGTVSLTAPVTLGHVVFDNLHSYTLAGSAANSLTLQVASGNGADITVTNGSHTISAPLVLASNTSVVGSGTLNTGSVSNAAAMTVSTTVHAGAIDGAGSVTVVAGKTLSAVHVRQSQLAVNSGALAAINPNGTNAGTSKVGTLGIAGATNAWTGRLDLGDNSLIVDYSGSSPIAQIQNQVKSGFAGGSWSGTGITSSAAAAAAAGMHKTALGINEAAAIGTTTFRGLPVDSTAVVVRYTYAGDANLDGTVDLTDFTFVAQSFNGAGQLWRQGDFNYDGNVDLTDFTFLAANFNQTIPGDGTAGATPVPEPASSAAAAAAAALVAAIMRRRSARRARAGR